MWLSKSLKLIFQHVEKLTILYKEVNCVKALRTVDLRGRGRSYLYSKA